MYYCTDLIARPVLSLYEGELIGNVSKLLFDKKLKRLLFLELVGENDNHFLLSTKNIYNIGKNAITIKNNTAVSLKIDDDGFVSCPISSKAFNIKGEFLGIIKEVILNDKFLCEKLSFENENVIDANMIASCGKNTIIFYDKLSKVDINKFVPNKVPKIFKSKQVSQANILPIQDVESPTAPIQIETTAKNMQNSDFLIGKICVKDIFNFNNELLIKAHTVVTQKNLKEINKFGKLRELMLYCK